MRHLKTFLLAAASVLPIAMGCGTAAPLQATSAQNLNAQIEALGDAAMNDGSFAEAFVAGAAPGNRKDYGMRGYEVVGEPTIDGDVASVPVRIFGGVIASTEGDNGSQTPTTVAETQQVWTLQRSGDSWKIKDAPLG